jgi:hypothetical protein
MDYKSAFPVSSNYFKYITRLKLFKYWNKRNFLNFFGATSWNNRIPNFCPETVHCTGTCTCFVWTCTSVSKFWPLSIIHYYHLYPNHIAYLLHSAVARCWTYHSHIHSKAELKIEVIELKLIQSLCREPNDNLKVLLSDHTCIYISFTSNKGSTGKTIS